MILSDTLHWVRGEQIEGIVVACSAVVILLVGIFLPRIVSSPAAKALMIPLIVVGGIYLAVGASIGLSATNEGKALTEKYQDSEQHGFVQDEIQRVQGFQSSYNTSRIITSLMLVAGLLLFWFSNVKTLNAFWLSHNITLQGIGIACVLFGLVGICVDYFSMHRAKAYYDILTSVLS
jgi:predicted DNA repair protein MutK